MSFSKIIKSLQPRNSQRRLTVKSSLRTLWLLHSLAPRYLTACLLVGILAGSNLSSQDLFGALNVKKNMDTPYRFVDIRILCVQDVPQKDIYNRDTCVATVPKCAACDKGHETFNRDCPVWKLEWKISEVRTEQRLSYKDARAQVVGPVATTPQTWHLVGRCSHFGGLHGSDWRQSSKC